MKKMPSITVQTVTLKSPAMKLFYITALTATMRVKPFSKIYHKPCFSPAEGQTVILSTMKPGNMCKA